ncbi:DUF222 domain-containing protein [Amycolatopsis sp. PS_44_ISF1]|uniref:DUF222 domain-containing protein n=1 Tax=Amycolatopsis sp. PS_44_ISF1 TaxID=2974917 RepID=UPI0028DD8458|nr:DUF222 domain-containing protein [Amycolatopsis sp. PS_44_ISF1]MDT8915688.1 13E12 repeat family protein [Amycolatopsis sp. PS_44_ISF1]
MNHSEPPKASTEQPTERIDPTFLLRAMQTNLEMFEQLHPDQLMQITRSASSEIARLQALQLHCVAGLRKRRSDRRELAAELALVLCITDNRAGAMISAAEALTNRLPRTLRLMDNGSLDLYRAMKVTDGTLWLTDHNARLVDIVLEKRISDKNPTQIRKATVYAAMKADPEGAANRAMRRRSERKVSLHQQDDGVATLSVDAAPAEKVNAAYLRIDKIARSLQTGNEKRTLDQIRTDVALDLLLTAKGGTSESTEAYLYVDLQTYLGLNSNPVELTGHGHVPAEVARHIAAGPNTTLRRLITDPLNGQVIEVGRFRYRPSADVDEFARIRDRECRHPGCSRPAQSCVTESTAVESAKSASDTDSILSYCLRHRHLKDRVDWDYRVRADGKLVVTTPTGHSIESIPSPLHEQRPSSDELGETRLGA